MAISKVILNGETQMDVTPDTVTPEVMVEGYTALKNNGVRAVGTFVPNEGTVTEVATGTGLTGGPITSSGTVKANLVSETKLTNAATAATETSGRVYPVAVDKNGKLAVNVPWENSTYVAITDDINMATISGTISADEVSNWNAGTLPSISYTERSVGSASGWNAGTAASASASKGVLTLTNGTAPSLTVTSVSCDDITAWDDGTLPVLETTAKSIPQVSVASVEVVTGFIQNGSSNLSYVNPETLVQS